MWFLPEKKSARFWPEPEPEPKFGKALDLILSTPAWHNPLACYQFVNWKLDVIKLYKISTTCITHRQLNWQMKSRAWLLRLFVCLLSMKYPVMWKHQQMTFTSQYLNLLIIRSLFALWRSWIWSWIWLGLSSNFYLLTFSDECACLLVVKCYFSCNWFLIVFKGCNFLSHIKLLHTSWCLAVDIIGVWHESYPSSATVSSLSHVMRLHSYLMS